MNSQMRKIGRLLLLPVALFFVSAAVAQDANNGDDDDRPDRGEFPDLVISEDTQLALSGRNGKAVSGSCEKNLPLWEGKIALKNIGRELVEANPAPASRLEPQRPLNWPHIRAYVPNNIQLKSEARLVDDLGEYGQELVTLSIGKDEPKCRNYDAPPIFDERLSGRPGPIRVTQGPPGPGRGGYSWQVKKIQRALIGKGYSLPAGADGDWGPQSAHAVIAFFKDRGEPPPPGVHRRPLSPPTAAILLEALEVGGEEIRDSSAVTGTIGGGDDCKRGINLVPIYIEIDPDRQIVRENRSNNRVQFTVAIDCSNVAR